MQPEFYSDFAGFGVTIETSQTFPPPPPPLNRTRTIQVTNLASSRGRAAVDTPLPMAAYHTPLC